MAHSFYLVQFLIVISCLIVAINGSTPGSVPAFLSHIVYGVGSGIGHILSPLLVPPEQVYGGYNQQQPPYYDYYGHPDMYGHPPPIYVIHSPYGSGQASPAYGHTGQTLPGGVYGDGHQGVGGAVGQQGTVVARPSPSITYRMLEQSPPAVISPWNSQSPKSDVRVTVAVPSPSSPQSQQVPPSSETSTLHRIQAPSLDRHSWSSPQRQPTVRQPIYRQPPAVPCTTTPKPDIAVPLATRTQPQPVWHGGQPIVRQPWSPPVAVAQPTVHAQPMAGPVPAWPVSSPPVATVPSSPTANRKKKNFPMSPGNRIKQQQASVAVNQPSVMTPLSSSVVGQRLPAPVNITGRHHHSEPYPESFLPPALQPFASNYATYPPRPTVSWLEPLSRTTATYSYDDYSAPLAPTPRAPTPRAPTPVIHSLPHASQPMSPWQPVSDSTTVKPEVTMSPETSTTITTTVTPTTTSTVAPTTNKVTITKATTEPEISFGGRSFFDPIRIRVRPIVNNRMRYSLID